MKDGLALGFQCPECGNYSVIKIGRSHPPPSPKMKHMNDNGDDHVRLRCLKCGWEHNID